MWIKQFSLKQMHENVFASFSPQLRFELLNLNKSLSWVGAECSEWSVNDSAVDLEGK